MLYKRHITEKLKKALKRAAAVLVGGARQVGKTTLVKEIGKANGYSYTNLDLALVLANAKTNPDGFIDALEKPTILDEIQRAPELALAIKRDIDEQRHLSLAKGERVHGRYLLTGSANPLLLPTFSDALVGRMEIIKMYPFSQGELHRHEETFLTQIFLPKPTYKFNRITRKKLCEIMFEGGYPLIHGLSAEDRQAWFENLINTLLDRDVQDLARIEGLAKFPQILGVLGLRIGNLLNIAAIGNEVKITQPTLHRYITILERTFVLYLQPAWGTNLGDQFIKSPKAYLIDTGLLCYLTRINATSLIDSPLIGKVLENFVVMEILKQISWSPEQIKSYHFRSGSQIEVDLVLENFAGEIVAIEIKAGEDVGPADIKGIRHLKEIAKDKFLRGIVLYTGNTILPFEKDIHGVPISALWH